MLVGGVVDHQLDHHLHVAAVGGVEEGAKIVQRPVGRVHAAIVRDVVAVIAQGRREEGQKPQAGDAQVLQVVEFLHQPAEVAYAVVVAVKERLDRQLIDDGVLVPERVVCTSAALHGGCCLCRRISLTSGQTPRLPRSWSVSGRLPRLRRSFEAVTSPSHTASSLRARRLKTMKSRHVQGTLLAISLLTAPAVLAQEMAGADE